MLELNISFYFIKKIYFDQIDRKTEEKNFFVAK